jgi:hypothetical protein
MIPSVYMRAAGGRRLGQVRARERKTGEKKMAGDKKSYADLREELKTGDILLFSGKGAISDGIKFFCGSKWSHVGMVYRMKDNVGDSVFCWESTTLSNVQDAETGRLTKGVQRVELSERLERCFASGYEVSVRKLNQQLDMNMLIALDQFRHEISGRPYEKHRLELIKAAWDGWLGQNKEDLSSLFCSEMVAEAYQRMGLLSGDMPSNEYTPKDFSDERKLSLLEGYTLAAEIKIDGLGDSQPAGYRASDL